MVDSGLDTGSTAAAGGVSVDSLIAAKALSVSAAVPAAVIKAAAWTMGCMEIDDSMCGFWELLDHLTRTVYARLKLFLHC